MAAAEDVVMAVGSSGSIKRQGEIPAFTLSKC